MQDGLTWSRKRSSLLSCILFVANGVKSLGFRKETETDVGENHKVLDLRVLYSTDQGKPSLTL